MTVAALYILKIIFCQEAIGGVDFRSDEFDLARGEIVAPGPAERWETVFNEGSAVWFLGKPASGAIN